MLPVLITKESRNYYICSPIIPHIDSLLLKTNKWIKFTLGKWIGFNSHVNTYIYTVILWGILVLDFSAKWFIIPGGGSPWGLHLNK